MNSQTSGAIAPARRIVVFALASVLMHALVLMTLAMVPDHDFNAPVTTMDVQLVTPLEPPQPVISAVADTSRVQPTTAPSQRTREQATSNMGEQEVPVAKAVDAPEKPEPTVTVVIAGSPRADQPPAEIATAKRETSSPGLVVTAPGFAASYLRNADPEYPRAAQRNRQEGTVFMRVLVTPDGLPARVELDKSSGYATLDRAALDAVKAWRFVPARRGEERIQDWVRVPVVFRLNDAS